MPSSSQEWLIRHISTKTKTPFSTVRLKALGPRPDVSLAKDFPDGEDPELELLVPLAGLKKPAAALLISSALVGFVAAISYLSTDLSTVVSMRLSSCFSSWWTPVLVEKFGRKTTLLGAQVIALGGAACYLADERVALALLSAVAGVVRTAGPLLLAEISPITLRGEVGFAHGAAVSLGAALGSCLIFFDKEHELTALSLGLCVLAAMCCLWFFVPESPRWLLRRGGSLERLMATLVAQGAIQATPVDQGIRWLTEDQEDEVQEADLQLFMALRKARQSGSRRRRRSSFELLKQQNSSLLILGALGLAQGLTQGGLVALVGQLDATNTRNIWTFECVAPVSFALAVPLLAVGSRFVDTLGRRAVLCDAMAAMSLGAALSASSDIILTAIGVATFILANTLALATVLFVVLVELFDCFDRPAALGVLNTTSQLATLIVQVAIIYAKNSKRPSKNLPIACASLALFALVALCIALYFLSSKASRMNFTGHYSPKDRGTEDDDERTPLVTTGGATTSQTAATTKKKKLKKHLSSSTTNPMNAPMPPPAASQRRQRQPRNLKKNNTSFKPPADDNESPASPSSQSSDDDHHAIL